MPVVFTYLFEALVMALFKNMTSMSDVMAMFFVFFTSLILIGYVKSNRHLSPFFKPLVLGYCFRIFLLLFDLYGQRIYQLPNSGSDSNVYYNGAVMFLQNGVSGRGGQFSVVMGTLMKISGPSRLFSQYMIVLFSFFALCLMVKSLSLFEGVDFKAKNRAVSTVSILPNFAILSSIYLRESLITMIITYSLYWFAKWIKTGNIKDIVIAFGLGFCAAIFHSGSAAVSIGYIGAYILYDAQNRELRIRAKNVILSIVMVGIIAFLYTRYTTVFFSKMQDVDSITDVANVSERGGSSYVQFVGNSNSPVSMIFYTIPRMIYFLFSPFPWQWRDPGDIIAFLFSSVFYAVVVKDAIQAIKNGHDNKSTIILLFIVGLITWFVFAWGVSNTGTAIRHRDKMITLYGILYALSQPIRSTKRKNKSGRRNYHYSI